MKINNNIKFKNGAIKETAEKILLKINNDLGYREKEILNNLESIENNKDVPEGYIQYVFYDKEGNGFQAGKYNNGRYGITL